MQARSRSSMSAMTLAAGYEIGAGLFERHITFYHIHNIEAVKQILNEVFWNHAITAFSHTLQKVKEWVWCYPARY